MVQLYIRAVSNVSRALGVVATLLIIAAMVVVCQMIVVRYILGWATIWQTDFVVFSATAAIFVGAPYVLLKGGHVGVDVVEMMVAPKTRSILKLIGQCLGLAFCLIMVWASWIQFHEAYVNDWRQSTIWAPPLWIPLSALPIGFGMLCLQYVAEILHTLTSPVAKETGVIAELKASGEAGALSAAKDTQP
ncbi:TRAP transporter small permease subunit [Pararhizobium haloflavum]|uniref:TRAP transporter small permease subunit n=1 Tax=Pararhizobium haloflavum TaxID=2037914 RepID=UPI000C1A2D91|nr:TRAP transporter small permease [Pararhizobium haloflavum]